MNFARQYKSFLHSQHLYEGVRVTAGILIPALLMSYFDLLSTGILLSLGAMCVSVTDSQGPIRHRRNGMFACIISIFVVTIVVGFAAGSVVVLGIVIFVLCFFFSMLNIYGARAGAVGIASLLILVLNLQGNREGWEVLSRALYIASGGLWYMCLSILLYNVRPFKLAQQALGDCLHSVADYLRLRADFYTKGLEYEVNYRRLLQQQAIVQEKQNVVSELLFKTRDIVKETTPTGRILVMMYMDLSDMFERIMTSYQFYRTLHDYFDETDILEHYRSVALLLATEIDEIAVSVMSGAPSMPGRLVGNRIKETKKKLDELRSSFMKPANMEGFINLRRIIENIEDIYSRVQTLHQYTTYDQSLTKKTSHNVDYDKFISHQVITPGMLLDNLTFRSENFRHSLRVSIAVIFGYVGSLFFPLGHSYWILLTIVVILKPAYSLTKSRNKDRLLGTVIGLIIGVIVIYAVDNRDAHFAIMIVFMLGTYIFLRKNYFASVIMMTPYIILFFHLLNPALFKSVLADRLIDTVIGSAIAFAANQFLFPAWEREKIMPALANMLSKAISYFEAIVKREDDRQDGVQQQQYCRKDALVALANLSDTFNRMLSEPESKKQGIEEIHHFVVMCHMLMSHLATLAMFSQKKYDRQQFINLHNLSNRIINYLRSALASLEGVDAVENLQELKEQLKQVNEAVTGLLEKRQEELNAGLVESDTRKLLTEVKSLTDQYNFIFNIAQDIMKTAKVLRGTEE